MNAFTPFGPTHLIMGSNVARDFKSRASDFKNKASAIFEYVVNGYEGYNLDQTPVVEVTTKGGKVVIRDYGIGMDLEKLGQFWTMHGATQRRENGRNKRGYHGSGKSAFFSFADKIEVRSVRNGLLNVMSLDAEEIEVASRSCLPPRIHQDVTDRPTDEANGTTITISRLREKVSTEDVRQLVDKVSENLRLVMTGAQVTVNGVPVTERPVRGVETSVTSICGNFTATFFHNDAGHAADDDRVFFMVGGVYIAATQTGKEGHRFSHQVSVLVDTTKKWAEENFESRREHFMSEARDLTLKTSDPAARELHDFAEHAVRDFMKKLDDEDRARKKEQASEQEKRLLANMSRIFSSHILFGGATPKRGKQEEQGDKVVAEVEHEVEHKARQNSGRGRNDNQRKPKIEFDFKEYAMTDAPFQIERGDTLMVYVNKSSKVYKALSQDDEDTVRNAVIWDIAAQAVCQIAVEQTIADHVEKSGPVDPLDVVKWQADKWAKVKNVLSDVYAAGGAQLPTTA